VSKFWSSQHGKLSKKALFLCPLQKKSHKGELKKWYLGVTKVADLQARRRAAIQQRVLQLQVPVANLLANPNKICSCAQLISIYFYFVA